MKRAFDRKLIVYFVKMVIGCYLYFYLFFNKKIDFTFFEYKYILLLSILFILQVVMFIAGTVRWHLIGRHAYNMRISLLSTAYISWVAQFFSTFLPSTIGADLSRIFYVSKKTDISKINLIKITIADRLSGLLAMAICSFLGLLFFYQKSGLLMSIFTLTSILAFLRLFPKKRLRKFLFKKNIHLPPFSVVVLSFFNFILKAFSLFIIIYFLTGKAKINDFYLCLGSQFIEGMAILPANIGMGHILFDKALRFIEVLNGAQIYNIYFTIKVLFKFTGFAGWLFIQKSNSNEKV